MRILEIVLAILILPTLLVPLLSGRRLRHANGLALSIVIAMLAQLLVEGYRWQMLPLYVLALLMLFSAAFRLMRYPRRAQRPLGFANKAAGVIGLVMLAVGVGLAVLVPVPALPSPAGPYPIGTFSKMLVDEGRGDIYAADPSQARKLMIKVWYPTEPQPEGKLAAWKDDIAISGPAIAEWMGLPGFALDHIRYARTHAFTDAPLLGGERFFPVLLFSHGWKGFREQNTYQAEELASRGYIVVAVQHTYGAMVTVFPDGTVAPNNPAGLPFGVPEAEYDAAADRLVDQWASDLAFVADTLERWNDADPDARFTGRLDLARLGVLGHSTGGGAAVEFCGRDPRCQAGLGMDAYLAPVSEKVMEQGVEQPFLFLYSEAWSGDNVLFARLYKASAQAQEISIMGTKHLDFTDLPMFSPLAPVLGLKGPLNGARTLSIINDLTQAFFDREFMGGYGVLLEGPSSGYPELEYGRLP